MAGGRGEGVLLFMVTNEPGYITFAELATLTHVSRVVRERAQAFLSRVAPYQLYYRLLCSCFMVPPEMRKFEENHWAHVVHAVPGGLSRWTAQHWSIYYVYWYHKAVQCASMRTVELCADGGYESKVSLLLSHDGLLKQLPNENGTLTMNFQELVYMMTIAHCRKPEPVKSLYTVVPGRQACDWNLFLLLLNPMAHAVDAHNSAPVAVKAQQLVMHLGAVDAHIASSAVHVSLPSSPATEPLN